MTKRKSELAGLCFDRHGFTCGSSPASRLRLRLPPPSVPASPREFQEPEMTEAHSLPPPTSAPASEEAPLGLSTPTLLVLEPQGACGAAGVLCLPGSPGDAGRREPVLCPCVCRVLLVCGAVLLGRPAGPKQLKPAVLSQDSFLLTGQAPSPRHAPGVLQSTDGQTDACGLDRILEGTGWGGGLLDKPAGSRVLGSLVENSTGLGAGLGSELWTVGESSQCHEEKELPRNQDSLGVRRPAARPPLPLPLPCPCPASAPALPLPCPCPRPRGGGACLPPGGPPRDDLRPRCSPRAALTPKETLPGGPRLPGLLIPEFVLYTGQHSCF